MIILCWNCQGLGKVEAVQHLKHYVNLHKHDLLFLCETKLKNTAYSRLGDLLGMALAFSVDFSFNCSGLALFTLNNNNVDLLAYSDRFIHTYIKCNSSSFYFTGIHGFSETCNKPKTWELIDSFNINDNQPWLIGGDFNEILSDNEKQGGSRRPRSQINNFRNCLSRNNLYDCKPTMGWFTWSKTGPKTTPLFERLDRFVGNMAWKASFPNYNITSEFDAKSDHCFLLLNTEPLPPTNSRPPPTKFRFENCWASNEEGIAVVKQTWSSTKGNTLEKIKAVGSCLGDWQSQQRFKSNGRIKFLTKKINKLLQRPLSSTAEKRYISAKTELHKLLMEQEAYWAQRSRNLWLSQGDKNTRFFHARASNRKKKNTISGLLDSNNVWRTNDSDLMEIASSYFHTLFSSSNPHFSDQILSKITPTITNTMNESLSKEFTPEEIITAFRDIDPRKAPGIDGLPSGFFRQHWDTVGPDIITLCLNLLKGSADMASVNQTILVLIPKIKDPTTMRHLRPISLCTVIYKIIAKVLVNRMKHTIPFCINSNQAAFVQGRNITDNILIAHEIIHSINTGTSKSSRGAALKLDMEKAFDRVEWSFLENVMTRMGFASSWVSLIMRCISSVSFTVKVNNSFSPLFRPQRGLRQGDPLSPFLFLFCTQGLSAFLDDAKQQGLLPGLGACKHGPKVNHLLFADDCLVFLNSNPDEAAHLKLALQTYASASGQAVNFDKSTIFYNPRTPTSTRQTINSYLQVREVSNPGVYLGVPLLIGKNKTLALGFIRDKVHDRLSNWDKQLLSYSGREIFIKAVLQSLPQYIMSCYLLPQNIIDDMTSAIRRYWWSGKSNKKGWHMLPWDQVCLPKSVGGMGFRDLNNFNIALLGKQLWRLICEPDSLLGQIYKFKYFPTGNILNASRPLRGSFAWQGLYNAMQHLYGGFLYRPGINSNIRIHHDNWGGSSTVHLYGDYELSEEVHIRCRDFMLRNQAAWDPVKVRAYFTVDNVNSILSVPIINDTRDTILWKPNDSGIYSVRSGYLFLQRPPEPRLRPPRFWKFLAKLKVLPKVKTFGWRLGAGALPVGARLQTFAPDSGPCPICNSGIESILHALRDCSGASETLKLIGLPSFFINSSASTGLHWLEEGASLLSPDLFGLFLTTLWNIWNRRNDWVHNKHLQPPWLIAVNSISLHKDYSNAISSSTSSVPSSLPPRWRLPPCGFIKVNVDGAFDPSTRAAAVGVVARDDTGTVVGGLAFPLGSCSDAISSEGKGLLAGITFARSQGWSHLIFETDCASLANRINSLGPDLSPLGPMILEAHTALEDFSEAHIQYIRHEANFVAHTLATHALRSMSSLSFGSIYPDCIKNIVLCEV
ncbi:hypothetical protein HRI_002155900 [Hibiscus trionum]|uniref:Reverse transcriptase domain-containing protein n=1 Tax=Hibiscus trionum TaxID=183268 RepID=A0A9W7HXI0_HIBTR|nr:hypothetical protein HRI_002155900 [Hibiscus trionum]